MKNENAQESRSSFQTMQALWPAICLAKKMGEGMGRGAILLYSLPQR
jgi:hypothetical protein